jgi:hypothetical protein
MAVATVEASSPEEAVRKFAERNPDAANRKDNISVRSPDDPAGRWFDTSTGKVVACKSRQSADTTHLDI